MGRTFRPTTTAATSSLKEKKARARILVMDLSPGWEVSFLTALAAKDPSVECDLFVGPQREAAPTGRIHRAADFAAQLATADAVVLGSVSDAVLTPAVTDGIKRFVERGGGLMVLPGPSSLYETPGAWQRLRDILPVAGNAPFQFVLQYTLVGPGSRAASHPVTAPLVPLLSQTEWQERAPLLGFYNGVTTKPGAEMLIGVRGRPVPALAYQTVGKGRVAAVAAGPLWRWRFLGGNSGAYDELMTRLLDVLTRGEEAGRFVLVARKNVFDAGEHPVFYAEVFNDKLQPVTGVPVSVEVSRGDSTGDDTPLERVAMHREGDQDTRLAGTLDPLPAGRYTVRLVRRSSRLHHPVQAAPFPCVADLGRIPQHRAGPRRPRAHRASHGRRVHHAGRRGRAREKDRCLSARSSCGFRIRPAREHALVRCSSSAPLCRMASANVQA